MLAALALGSLLAAMTSDDLDKIKTLAALGKYKEVFAQLGPARYLAFVRRLTGTSYRQAHAVLREIYLTELTLVVISELGTDADVWVHADSPDLSTGISRFDLLVVDAEVQDFMGAMRWRLDEIARVYYLGEPDRTASGWPANLASYSRLIPHPTSKFRHQPVSEHGYDLVRVDIDTVSFRGMARAWLDAKYPRCGVNADWIDEAWHLGSLRGGASGRPNTISGDFYVVSDEGLNSLHIFRRWYVDDGYDDSGNDVIEEYASGLLTYEDLVTALRELVGSDIPAGPAGPRERK